MSVQATALQTRLTSERAHELSSRHKSEHPLSPELLNPLSLSVGESLHGRSFTPMDNVVDTSLNNSAMILINKQDLPDDDAKGAYEDDVGMDDDDATDVEPTPEDSHVKTNSVTLNLQRFALGPISLFESMQHQSTHSIDDSTQKEYSAFDREDIDLTLDQLRFGMTEKRLRYILDPDWKWRKIWDLLVVAFVVYNAFEVPFRVGFEAAPNDPFSKFTTTFFDVFFMVDIAVNFVTTYMDDKSHYLVNDYHKVAMHYFQSWFVIDFVSAVPWDSLLSTIDPSTNSLTVLGPLDSLRLLRLAKIVKILSRFTRHVGYVVRIFLSISWFIIWGHFVACFFHWLGLVEIQQGKHSWITQYEVDSSDDKSHSYGYSIYWSIMTMTTVGYGDISATTHAERLAVSFIMLGSALCYASIFGSVSLSLSQLSGDYSAYRNKVDHLQMYLQDLGLPRHFRARARHYIDYMWDKTHGLGDQMHELPDRVKLEAVTLAHQEMLRKSSLFLFLQHSILSEVSSSLQFTVALPFEMIITKGLLAENVFFIKRGKVQIKDKNGRVLCYLDEGSYFGDIPIMLKLHRHEKMKFPIYEISARAITHCDLYFIPSNDLKKLLRSYPELNRLMFQIALHRHRKASFYYDEAMIDRIVMYHLRHPKYKHSFIQPKLFDMPTNIGISDPFADKKGKSKNDPFSSNPQDITNKSSADVTRTISNTRALFSQMAHKEKPTTKPLTVAVEMGATDEAVSTAAGNATADDINIGNATADDINIDTTAEDEQKQSTIAVESGTDGANVTTNTDANVAPKNESKSWKDMSWKQMKKRLQSDATTENGCVRLWRKLLRKDSTDDAPIESDIQFQTSIKALKETFISIADDETGTVSPEVFFAEFEGVGYMTREDLQKAWDIIDADKDGTLDYAEFIQLCTDVAILHPTVGPEELLIRSLHYIIETLDDRLETTEKRHRRSDHSRSSHKRTRRRLSAIKPNIAKSKLKATPPLSVVHSHSTTSNVSRATTMRLPTASQGSQTIEITHDEFIALKSIMSKIEAANAPPTPAATVHKSPIAMGAMSTPVPDGSDEDSQESSEIHNDGFAE